MNGAALRMTQREAARMGEDEFKRERDEARAEADHLRLRLRNLEAGAMQETADDLDSLLSDLRRQVQVIRTCSATTVKLETHRKVGLYGQRLADRLSQIIQRYEGGEG